jgi:5-bromo-4-chloroindolyl phosphate hydrolysis protein
MGKDNFSNIGDEIKDIVQNAVNSREFRQLNKNIENTVNTALDELRKSLNYNKNTWENNLNRQRWDNQNWDRQNRDRQKWDRQNRRTQNYNNRSDLSFFTKRQADRYKNLPSDMVPIGRVSAILHTVFGSIGIGLIGIAILVLGILGSVLNMDLFYKILIGLSPLFAGSLFLTVRGSAIRKRLKRFYQYIGIMKNKNYCMIQELSKLSGQKSSFIIKDLSKMIAIGMFPEGHLDEQKTCFMLNNESYGQYLKLRESMKAQQVEEEKINLQSKSGEEPQNPQLKKAIEDGKAYVRQIREANDAIPGAEISQKLYHLENVTSKIFAYVELHPEQLPDIQKFMDYYLPTTAKLLNAYREFDLQPVQGENISSAKKEIEDTLDTINLAFEKLLDSLFQDAAIDISTDISVLHTMLKQEGLAEKDFK